MDYTIWLTGLPCCGKTTLANYLKENNFYSYQILDGDQVREFVQNKDMSLDGRYLHLSYIAYCAKLLNDNGIGVICAFVSPTNKIRKNIDRIIGNKIFNVFVNTRIQECQRRDVKGMWELAEEGKIKKFTGMPDGDWEIPDNSDLVVNTEKYSVEECGHYIMENFEQWKFLCEK